MFNSSPSFTFDSPVLTPQHIANLLAGATDDKLFFTLTDLVNLLLAGSLGKEINTIIYCGRLITLSDKDGGVRPIQLQQLEVGVSKGAAVHATRRLWKNLPFGNVIVKLHFSNSFNCIRRDVVLGVVAAR